MPAYPLSARLKTVRALLLGLTFVNLFAPPSLTGTVLGQELATVPHVASTSCGAPKAEGGVALRASTMKAGLSLCDGYPLSSGGSVGSLGTPLALASSDFDEDGVPDLVSGFSSGSGGTVVIHRGNIAALWPYGAAIQNGAPTAFLLNPHSFSVPEAPDFVVTGDFDADGHTDIVTGHRGSTALYFLKGDGHGSFAAPKRIEVAGVITDMIAGEMNRPDGLADIVVGVTGKGGSAALVYQSPRGALKDKPESFPLTQPVTAMALGKLVGSSMRDLAIGAGNELILIHGRDRKLSFSSNEPVGPAVVTKQNLGFGIRALAAGDFTGRGPSVAVLGDDGNIHVLERTVSAEALATLSGRNVTPSLQVVGGNKAGATASGLTNGAQTRLAMLREMASLNMSSNAPEWSERSTVQLPRGSGEATHALVAARISGSLQEDLLVLDSANNQIHVLSTAGGEKQSKSVKAAATSTSVPQMSVLASLEATNTPAAVLPMRLNQHGLSGLVALQANVKSPVVMPHDVPPTAVFTVTNTLDITDPSQKNSPPDGSLRAAMENAEYASVENSGGTYSIVFDIPTSDPGYNPETGIFKIQPLSENVPNSDDDFALPPINATVTIDGYTQPGASPNTSATADNAKILIQIDGSKATTPGGAGLAPFDDVGTVIRGLAITGWTSADISSSGTASGAEGITAGGVGDFIEGNFIGTPDGTTAGENRIGIFGDNGPLFGSAPGNTFGGTTPQARNILSGNSVGGMLFLATSYEAQLEGSFLGLDRTGKAALPNAFDGVGLNGPTITVGGTAPGSGNVIAGNGTNVDLNDLTEGGAAQDSYVEGNLIGTDASGTEAIANQGYGVSILHDVSNMTVGGTTPAARNLISGNLAGVYVFDDSLNNVVQGNYIGTDITGSLALANSQQGFISGSTGSPEPPAAGTTIGGTVAGAGNVISGNASDGIQISGAYQSDDQSPFLGSTIQGNLIGTDVTGIKSVPNQGNGVSILSGGTNNAIGGTATGLGNVIANNTLNGVNIDPGTGNGPGVANVTIANTIFSNGGAGVRVKTGTGNRISANSIYSNAALGIDIDVAGPGTDSHCNSVNNGANMLQNYPVLTPGSGTTYITATATDPNGNTSEFSKAVPATQTANLLSLMGTFDGTANTSFDIEFFSSPAADPSGYGQGKTYLGSATIATDANCTSTISNPVDLTQADVSVSLSESTQNLNTGPDLDFYTYTATVSNNGPATAHSVTLTDVLPAQLELSSAYCDVAQCQLPITTTQGACTVSGKTITCNLGTMATGGTASITIPVQVLAVGGITNTVNVSATEVDPNLANNVASQSATATDPYPLIDHLDPATALVNSPDTVINVYGTGFTSDLTATFNGTPVTVVGLADNQVCGGPFEPAFCSDLELLIPAAQLTTAGSYAVVVSDPAGDQSSAQFTVASACTYSVYSDLDSDYENTGTNLIAGTVGVTTNVSSCPWTATSSVPWAVILDNASAAGSANVDIAIAPNTTTSVRSGSVTIAGNTFTFTQDAGSTDICSVGLDPSTATAPAAGGSGSIAATLSNSSCAPFAEAYPDSSWITITNSSNLLLASGPVTYTVAPNNGPARTGAIAVGGNATTITQAAPSCYFTLSTSPVIAPVGGGMGSITVTPTPSSCAWTATSSSTSQVKVTSGASGTGTGTVKYTVEPNTGGPITPTITIGNSVATSVFTIDQASAYTCTFTLTPTPVSVTSNGTSNFVTITASYGFCKWTAASNNPDSLTITGATSGTGTAAVYYSVAQNATGASRTLTLTAGCQTFTVNQDGSTAANNPTPALTSLQPSSVTAGSAAFTLTINGTGFVSGSVANLNGSPRITTYVSSTQLTVAIPASDITNVGSAQITVTNPSPGGGTSNTLTLTINASNNNPVPVLTSLQPSSTTAGSAAFTLTANGTGFVSGAIVNFKGSARTTTYVSSTQVTAAILASDVTTAGTASVTVSNPTPGGGTSNALTFTINAASNPAPTLTALQPSSTTAGSAAFTLTLSGTNFVSGSVVNFGGATLTTTYVSASQLTAAVPATAVAAAGTPSVTVTNPTPGGGTSNALTFTVTSVTTNPVPVLTSLQPSSTNAGSAAFTLTVNGTGFVSGATVNFNGNAHTTTYVNSTQVTAAILAADVTTAGTAPVTVANPAPGGGTSNALTFTISNVTTNPVPVLASLQPSSTNAGSAAFTLTVNGTGFVSGASVNFNGSARITTYVNSTQVTAAILATDVTTAGTASITLTNPAPGGGTSNALTFTINASTGPTPAFTLSSSGAQTIAPTGSAQYTITATAVNGPYTNPITFSVSGLPPGATATFNPASVTPNATSAQSTLTITLGQAVAKSNHPSRGWSLAFLGVPLLGLLIFRRPQRKRFIAMGTLLLGLVVSLGTFTGCGQNGFDYSTVSPQTYNITVTGTGGSTSATTTVQLTVNYVTN